jgi:hypothetical protein
VVQDSVKEDFSGGVGGEAQDLSARDSSKASGAVDEEEAQRAWQQLSILAHNLTRSFQLHATLAPPKPRLHAGDSVAISSLARATIGAVVADRSLLELVTGATKVTVRHTYVPDSHTNYRDGGWQNNYFDAATRPMCLLLVAS